MQSKSFKRSKHLEIKKIAIFFNNKRGLKITNYLKSNNYLVYNIITKKFINKSILNSVKRENTIFINNLNNKKLIFFLKKEKFDLFISAGFPHLFKKEFFSLSRHGIINLHAGRLPKYRGGSPLVWQIINGEKTIGLSVIKIDKGIDTGKIICETKFKNIKRYSINDVHHQANKKFVKLCSKAIKKIEKKTSFKKQPKSKSYFKQRSDEDAYINFNYSSSKVYDFVRAQTKPYKGAFFFNSKKKFRLHNCKIVKLSPKIGTGKVFKFKNYNNYYIKCNNSSIKILKINPGIKKIKDLIIL